MVYQTIMNLLDNEITQTPRYWTKRWAEIIEDALAMKNSNSQIKFNTTKLKSGYAITVMRTYLRKEQ